MLSIPIVFSVDDNYVLPLCVSIQSLISKKKRNVRLLIYVFYDELSEENKEILSFLSSKNCLIELVCIREFLNDTNFYVDRYLSIATYYRFFAPIVLKHFDKIIYLDCDLILNKCVSHLYKQDIGENYLAGVQDTFTNQKGVYINAGVLLINCKKYLQDEICSKCINFVNENRNLTCFDQDALNFVCKDHIKLINCKFNFYHANCYEKENLLKTNVKNLKDIVIIHYIMEKKPWKFIDYPLANLWWNQSNKLPKDVSKMIEDKYVKNLDRGYNYSIYYRIHFLNPFRLFINKIKAKITKIIRRKN